MGKNTTVTYTVLAAPISFEPIAAAALGEGSGVGGDPIVFQLTTAAKVLTHTPSTVTWQAGEILVGLLFFFALIFTRELCQIAVLPPGEEQRTAIVPSVWYPPKVSETDHFLGDFDPKLHRRCSKVVGSPSQLRG
jgi:hypothetical protein